MNIFSFVVTARTNTMTASLKHKSLYDTYGLQKERLLYWGKLLKYIGLRVHRHDKKR